jgi:signal transduction histidine kinase
LPELAAPSPVEPSARFYRRKQTAGGAIDRLHTELSDLAELAMRASGALDCFIAWQNRLGGGIARAASAPARLATIEAAILSRIENSDSGDESFSVDAADFSAMSGPQPSACGMRVVARRMGQGGDAIIAVMIVDDTAGGGGAETAIDAVARLAFAVGLRSGAGTAIDGWRQRAFDSYRREAQTSAQVAAADDEQRTVEDALAKMRGLAARGWFAGVAQIAAGLGPFNAWAIVLAHGGKLRVEGAYGLAIGAIEPNSGIAQTWRRRRSIWRDTSGGRAAAYPEDELIRSGGFRSYLCAPMGDGAIVLASRIALDSAARRRAELFLDRLQDHAHAQQLEDELRAERGLNARLAMRLFAAIDGERARIARDLHDDQAQILAAARIAIARRRAGAGAILKRLEAELREKISSLRPVRLGRRSLREAIANEAGRLEAAGIRTSVELAAMARSGQRSVQQLCYQVVREAVSNVIRHARATRVSIALARERGRLRLEIVDNGRGFAREGRGSARIGIEGIAERLAILGGSLKIDSHRGRTRLAAEIPEIAR